MSVKRISWIDQIKGFAIICMVISHAIPGYSVALKNWITAFNMPLFFFVSGILVSDRVYTLAGLPSYLKRRFFSLGIPYLFFCMLYIFFIAGLSFVTGDSLNAIVNQLITNVKSVLYMFGIQSMWFLPVFFFSTLLDSFVLSRIESKQIYIALTVIFIFVLLFIDRNPELSLWIRLAGKIIGAEVFIMWGRVMTVLIKRIKIGVIFVGLLIFTNLALMNGFVSLNFEYGNYPILFFINAIMLSVFLCALFARYGENLKGRTNKLLCEFGMNSIAILVTNNLIIEILRLADHKLFDSFCLNHGMTGYLFFALLILLAEYPILRLSRGKLAVLFGKRRLMYD